MTASSFGRFGGVHLKVIGRPIAQLSRPTRRPRRCRPQRGRASSPLRRASFSALVRISTLRYITVLRSSAAPGRLATARWRAILLIAAVDVFPIVVILAAVQNRGVFQDVI